MSKNSNNGNNKISKNIKISEEEYFKFFKYKIFSLIFWIVIIGLIFPFGAQVILPFIFKDIDVDVISIWNQFVGIILGVIATLMSVVSLVLCFRSEEKSYENNKNIEMKLNSLTYKTDTLLDKSAKNSSPVSNNEEHKGGVPHPGDEDVI